MIARAPGKVVLAGAYAVLEGAPAWVAAVNRYVVADSRRTPSLVTPEVRAALHEAHAAPWFDARELRDAATSRKLGLGSSAAILVASLAALELERSPELGDDALANRVFAPALRAHRAAQGGGSGIDVAASTFGGVLRLQRAAPEATPDVAARQLPTGLTIAVWSSPEAAQTSTMVARVTALLRESDRECRAILSRLRAAAEACDSADSATTWLEICREQLAGLTALGARANLPIITPAMRAFQESVRDCSVVVLPSGAGGGDVILVMSQGPLEASVEPAGRALGLVPLDLSLGARGVHAQPSDPSSLLQRKRLT